MGNDAKRSTGGGYGYFTPADQANEDRAMARFAKAYPEFALGRCYKSAPVDFYIMRVATKRVVGWMEVKTRTFASTDHPSVFITWQKYVSLRQWSEWSGQMSYYAVQLDDAMFAIRIDAIFVHGRLVVRGRHDRPDDPFAHEPSVEVMLRMMQRID